MSKLRTCHPVQRRRAAYDLTIAELVTEIRQRADDPAACAEIAAMIASASAAKAAIDNEGGSARVPCWRCGADLDLDTEPFVMVNVAAVSRVEAEGMAAAAQTIFTSPERFADGSEAPELVLCATCGDLLDATCLEQEARAVDRAELSRRRR